MIDAFAAADAPARGVSKRTARAHHHPFVGVRAAEPAATIHDLARAYLPKMAPHEFFTHRTAAVLHGIALPEGDALALRLDVSVVKPHRAPRDARVVGHHVADRPGLVWEVDGLRVANPVETLCQLATVLSEDDLIVAAESLLPPDEPGSARSRILLDRIVTAFSDEHRPGRRKMHRALPRIRIGSRSPQETRFRLLLVAAGLPEPAMNHRPKGLYAEGDLVYVKERVWIEAEGDRHRTDRARWRNDVVKHERLRDAAWRVIRVTDDDLVERPEETVERVRRALGR